MTSLHAFSARLMYSYSCERVQLAVWSVVPVDVTSFRVLTDDRLRLPSFLSLFLTSVRSQGDQMSSHKREAGAIIARQYLNGSRYN